VAVISQLSTMYPLSQTMDTNIFKLLSYRVFLVVCVATFSAVTTYLFLWP